MGIRPNLRLNESRERVIWNLAKDVIEESEVRNYQSLKCLYRYVHDEKMDDCSKCPEKLGMACYAPDKPALFFDTSETTDIVFISEGPYSSADNKVINSQEFVERLNSKYLKDAAQNETLPESKPLNIFGFIYNVFRPIFQSSQDWAKMFLHNVYWTHAGKKPFNKSFSAGKRLKCARQCARQLLIEELQAIEPALIIVASSIASRILLGKGFTELFDEQRNKKGSFLDLRHEMKSGSLLYDAFDRGVFYKDWSCRLATFPNPSPAAARWKNPTYDENATVTRNMISNIHEELRKHLTDIK